MSVELRILSGARAGRRERLEKQVVTIGRHPQCDLRFDANEDLDVSARHAELRIVGGRIFLRDLGSTNGTFVNGVRVEGEKELLDGDELSFGAAGPRVSVHASAGAAAAVRTTPVRRVIVTTLLLLSVGVAGAYALGRRASDERDARIAELARRNDSLAAAYSDDVRLLASRIVGLDSALAAAGAARFDYEAIARRAAPVVALIIVELDDTTRWSGSAFAIGAGDHLVTNRHLVVDEHGRRPRRIAAIFSDSRAWLPARLVRVDERDDLALLALDESRPLAAAPLAPAPAAAGVGAPVAIIGYPLGLDTPMEGSGTRIRAKATLGVGVVSKSMEDVLQVDAFAGEGSSGSPVLDAHGRVVGVVHGGARESAGRIVYAVPGARLARFVAGELAGAPR